MWVRFLSLFLLLLSSKLVVAQPLPDRSPITGLVVDRAGKPLAGALLAIRRQEDNGSFAFWGGTTLSNERGEFRFPQAEIGRYYLNAELAGFAPVYNQNVDWKSGAGGLRIQFERLVSLKIKLLGPSGTPVANTPVWLRLRGDGNAGQKSQSSRTDDSGEFKLEGLLPARYSVYLASSQGFAVQSGLDLRSDTSQSLTLQKGGSVRVLVQDDSAPARFLGGAQFSLTPQDADEATRMVGEAADIGDNFALLASMGERLSLVTREVDGLIEISNLPPGRYLAKVVSPGYVPMPPRETTLVAGETVNLNWTLKPRNAAKASLSLQLSQPNGKLPQGEFMLRILPLAANGTLASEEIAEDPIPGGSPGRRALADAEGKITLFPLNVGRYRVWVSPFKLGRADNPPEAASLDISVPAEGATASLVLKPSP